MDKYAKKLQHKHNRQAGLKAWETRRAKQPAEQQYKFVTIVLTNGVVTNRRESVGKLDKMASMLSQKCRKLGKCGFEDLSKIFYPVKFKTKLSVNEQKEMSKVRKTFAVYRAGRTTVKMTVIPAD